MPSPLSPLRARSKYRFKKYARVSPFSKRMKTCLPGINDQKRFSWMENRGGGGKIQSTGAKTKTRTALEEVYPKIISPDPAISETSRIRSTCVIRGMQPRCGPSSRKLGRERKGRLGSGWPWLGSGSVALRRALAIMVRPWAGGESTGPFHSRAVVSRVHRPSQEAFHSCFGTRGGR